MKKLIYILIFIITTMPVYSQNLNGAVSRQNSIINNQQFIGDGSYTRTPVFTNNNDTMTVINSEFTNNLNRLDAGCIRNTGNGILDITGTNFNNNSASNGGAIYLNNGSSTILNSLFKGNSATTLGGSIYVNSGTLNITNSNLLDNKSQLGGGAIYIKSGNVTLDSTTVSNNSILGGATGGAISNNGTLTIKNNTVFSNNSASLGAGGAINNSGILNIENSVFDNNTCLNDGGAITSSGSVTLTNTTFSNNTSTNGMAGAIVSNNLKIDNCTFENNTAKTFGGAIISSDATINNSVFKNNTAQNYHGGAIVNLAGDIELNGHNLFEGNTAERNGGAIYGLANSIFTINGNSEFLNNSSTSGYGGAINTRGKLNINANGSNVLFSGNTDSRGSNAVHLDIDSSSSTVGTMNLNISNGGNVIFNDNISGVTGTKLNINGNSSYTDNVFFGQANRDFNGDITTNNISLNFLNSTSGMERAVISATNTHFNLMNGIINQTPLNLNLVGGGNSLSLDIDPQHFTADYINLYGNPSEMDKLVIRDINLLSEPTQSVTTFDIFDHENYGTELELSEELENTTVYGGLKTYRWALMPKLTLIELSGLNPNIQRYQGATGVAFMNQMLSYDYSLNRTDEIYMNLRANKLALQKLNSYASVGPAGMYVDLPYEDGSALWIRPYVNLETFHLSGAKGSVNNQSYGTMLGFDFPMINKRDWKIVPTIYGAYIGSCQEFLDSDMYQNGGYGGVLLSAYKDNFYLGWTANGGCVGVDSRYLSGSDKYAIITAGTALRMTYNWKIFKHFILQPNITTAYTFLSPSNLVNFQSVDLNQTQVNGLTVAPSLRLTYRNERGFEPYVYGGCVIPVMSDIKARANGINLEKLNLNTWAQFGAGIRKQITDRICCFAETVIRTGGRQGWGFMFNLQIAI